MKSIRVGPLLGSDDLIGVTILEPEFIEAQAQFRSNRFVCLGLTLERARELRDKLAEMLREFR